MTTVPSKLVHCSSSQDALVERIYTQVLGRPHGNARLPNWIVGDLLLGIIGRRPSVADDPRLPEYSWLLAHLIRRSSRWHYVVGRLDQLARRHRTEQLWNNIATHILDSALNSLLKYSVEASRTGSDEDVAEAIAAAYNAWAADFEDFSEPMFDDLEMALIELGRRARSMEFMELNSAKALIRKCAQAPLDGNVYRPRLLRETLRQGDRAPRLPGDYQSLRSVSLKTREDQIPRILPSELATNGWNGERGRRFTADKILNRQPAIYQNHDTQRPELNHRILIVFLNSVVHQPATGDEDVAELEAKALAHRLLVNAASKMPHDAIHADVAWFERNDPAHARLDWGAQFRLSSLKVTTSETERWRNVLEVDRFLPGLFIHAAGAVQASPMSEYTLIRDHPSDFLMRSCQGRYHGIFIVGIAPEGEAGTVTPAASTPLPELPAGAHAVLLITAGADQRRSLRGATFRNLLAARMASAVLPLPPNGIEAGAYFVEEFLKMIIGPIEQEATRSPRPAAVQPL